MTSYYATPLPPLNLSKDGDVWIVAEPETGIHGAGPSPLAALQDYELAVIEHADVEGDAA